MGRFELQRPLWWDEQRVTRFVAGVFEGGGAKGILYRGALEAMVEDRERPWWFAAAAGASAGAITATLVAAGFRPEQIAEQTEHGRERLDRRPTWLSGVLRVRDGESYLDQESLLEWLRELLERQVLELTGSEGGSSITFEDLHDLTKVELDVVAVDLMRLRPVIFNYKLTPSCQVAEAVLASAAIPLAFESQSLWVASPEAESVPKLGLIVDGGVISNFPQWVFTDRSFREWAELDQVPAEIPVVGFLLDEQGETAATKADVYRTAFFFPPPAKFGSREEFLAALENGYDPHDLKTRKFREQPARPGAGANVTRALLRILAVAAFPVKKLLLAWIPRFLTWNAGGERLMVPEPRNPALRSFLRWYDSLMAAVRPVGVLIGGFVVATLALAYGAYRAAWLPLAHLLESAVRGDTSIPGAIVGGIVLVLASVVPVYAWMLLTLTFAGGWVFHRAIQRTGYGLLRTFLQNPAAPPWAGKAANDLVVRLSVPDGLTTLEVGLTPRQLDAALEEARATTRAMLGALERRERGPLPY